MLTHLCDGRLEGDTQASLRSVLQLLLGKYIFEDEIERAPARTESLQEVEHVGQVPEGGYRLLAIL